MGKGGDWDENRDWTECDPKTYFRVDKSSNELICVINFKPTLLSHRLLRSTPDMVWLNPKSRFKLIPELIASSRAPKCIKSLGIRGSDRSKMTERFLEKQTTNFYSFFYSRRQPGINLGKFIHGLGAKTENE